MSTFDFIEDMKAGISKPKKKVWRVPIHANELIECGWQAGMSANDAWDKVLKPMIIAKGLPEGFTLERTPCKMSPTPTGIMLEFE